MNLGFIGFGEAAYSICKGFRHTQSFGEIVAFDAMWEHPRFGPLCRKRAGETDVTLLTDPCEVARRVDVLFVTVPCTQCVNVARTVAAELKEGHIYADLTAASPEEKQEIWQLIKDKGIYFADAALLGSVPPDLHKVPILASGNGADAFAEAMNPHGMRITSIAGEAGQASAVKLVRSIYMKGISAIMLEMMCLAQKYDVTEHVVSSIGRSMDPIPFESHLNRLLTGMAVHAQRRAVELGNSVEMQQRVELKPYMSIAAQKLHEVLFQSGLCEKYAGQRPESWQAVIDEVNHLGILDSNKQFN